MEQKEKRPVGRPRKLKPIQSIEYKEVSVDNKGNPLATYPGDKNGKLLLEIYYHKGKIHKYDGPAKIVYAPDGSILEELRFINDKLVITKHDHIKNWGKMFAKNLNLF